MSPTLQHNAELLAAIKATIEGPMEHGDHKHTVAIDDYVVVVNYTIEDFDDETATAYAYIYKDRYVPGHRIIGLLNYALLELQRKMQTDRDIRDRGPSLGDLLGSIPVGVMAAPAGLMQLLQNARYAEPEASAELAGATASSDTPDAGMGNIL